MRSVNFVSCTSTLNQFLDRLSWAGNEIPGWQDLANPDKAIEIRRWMTSIYGDYQNIKFRLDSPMEGWALLHTLSWADNFSRFIPAVSFVPDPSQRIIELTPDAIALEREIFHHWWTCSGPAPSSSKH